MVRLGAKLSIVLSAVTIVALFSGCTSKDTKDEAGEESEFGVSQDEAGGAGEAAENLAPVVSLKVLAGGAELTATSGTIAADADESLTFDASASSDPDGDVVSYAWTVDGAEANETTPSITRAFDGGDHRVAVTVSDAELSSDQSILIQIPLGESEDVPVQASAVLHETFAGTLAGGSISDPAGTDALVGDYVSHAFEVPAGATQIVVMTEWIDPVGEHMPVTSDIDVFLLNPAGASQASGETYNFEYVRLNDTKKLVEGTWKVQLLPYNVPDDVDYTVDVLVWTGSVGRSVFEGSVTGKVDAGTPADSAALSHMVSLPAASAVVARLTWFGAGQPGARVGSCTQGAIVPNDFDFFAKAGGKTQFQSQDGATCEFGFIAAEPDKPIPTGEWTFELVQFLVTDADYTLEVEWG